MSIEWDGRVRLGGPAAKRRRREELRNLIHSHLASHPATWLTAVELARVIRDQLSEPVPPSHGYHYGRSNIVMVLLRELAADHAVMARPHPDRRGATQWKISQPTRIPGSAK